MVILMKQGVLAPDYLVDIQRNPELVNLKYSPKGVVVGASVTHRELEQWSGIKQRYVALATALRKVGNIRIRSVGTIGGNLAYGEPQCNLPTVLAALDSTAVISNGSEERVVPVLHFTKDIFDTELKPGELLKEIRIPEMPPRSDCEFIKFCSRTAEEKPAATVACWIQLEEEGLMCKAARLVVGAVGSRLFDCNTAAKHLLNTQLDDESELREVGEKAKNEIDPIDDLYGTTSYKREVCGELIVRAIIEAKERLIRKVVDHD